MVRRPGSPGARRAADSDDPDTGLPVQRDVSTQAPTTVVLAGNLAGAPTGWTVTVRFTHPPRVTKVATVPGPVETVTATTDASGNWSASVRTSDRGARNVVGLVELRGCDRGGAWQAGPCTFTVALPTP